MHFPVAGKKSKATNMNKLLVMTQGFISNDKCSDANLTDMVPLYLSPIYLDKSVPLLIIIVIVIKILLRRGYFEFVTYGAAAYAIAGYWTGELKNVDRWTEVTIMIMLRAMIIMITILIVLVVIMITFLRITIKIMIRKRAGRRWPAIRTTTTG